jgi:ankyrin repeat protein
MVELLYEHGANVNELDNEGNSCIHHLVNIGDAKWLRHVAKNFNINCYLKNNKGNTPFMLACLNNSIEIVELFVDKIPNLNWKNRQGQTALHAAIFADNIQILEILLKHKADITIKDIVYIIYPE